MKKRLRAGIVGYGRMGRGFVAAMQQSEFWDVAAICDTSESSRELAAKSAPGAKILSQSDAIFSDKSIDVVGLFTLADARPGQIRQALHAKKHVIAEKPLAADVATEWQLVKEIEASDRLVAVNLFTAMRGITRTCSRSSPRGKSAIWRSSASAT
jgi:myo-inositol 2-dehydrogenase/D-chiro-inositol 1-dehydrogenase